MPPSNVESVSLDVCFLDKEKGVDQVAIAIEILAINASWNTSELDKNWFMESKVYVIWNDLSCVQYVFMY